MKRIAAMITAMALIASFSTPSSALQNLLAREDLRLGVVSDSGPFAFHRISAMTVDAAGRIYVGNSGRIGVFDSGGRFVREFGRTGQGPGEYRAINVLWTVGDTLVLTDWQAGGRTILFNVSNGAVLDSWSATNANASRTFVIGLGPNGWLGGAQPGTSARRGAMPPGTIIRDTARLHVLDRKTREVGALVRLLVPATRLVVGAGETGADWPLFEPRVGFVSTPRGLQFEVSNPHVYSIDVYDHSGAKVRTLTRPYTASRIATAEVEKFKGIIEEHYRRRPSPPGFTTLAQTLARVDTRAKMHMATSTSPFGRMLVSGDGELWVERPDLVKDIVRLEYERWYPAVNRMPGLAEPESKWDRFDAAGRYVGQVTLPANFNAMAVHAGAVYGVSRDSNDVEFVVRLRVQ